MKLFGKYIFVGVLVIAALRDFTTNDSNSDLYLFVIAGMAFVIAFEYVWGGKGSKS